MLEKSLGGASTGKSLNKTLKHCACTVESQTHNFLMQRLIKNENILCHTLSSKLLQSKVTLSTRRTCVDFNERSIMILQKRK